MEIMALTKGPMTHKQTVDFFEQPGTDIAGRIWSADDWDEHELPL